MVGAREDASRVRFIQHQDEYHGADRVHGVYKLAKWITALLDHGIASELDR